MVLTGAPGRVGARVDRWTSAHRPARAYALCARSGALWRAMRLGVAGAALAGCSAGVSGADDGSAGDTADNEPVPFRCPSLEVSEVGRVDDDRVTEASGLAWSGAEPGVLWVHNDSGDAARVLALDATSGEVLAERALDVPARDWEAAAWTPSARGGALVIGDIGDNGRSRGDVRLVVADGLTTTGPPPTVSVRTHPWPGDLGRDAEALLADPRDGALYVLSKASDGLTEVARVPDGDGEPLVVVSTLQLGAPPLDGVLDRLVTDAAFRGDGALVVVRTYTALLVWPVGPQQSLVDALAAAPCQGAPGPQLQGETVAAGPDALYSVAEGLRQPLLRYELAAPEP